MQNETYISKFLDYIKLEKRYSSHTIISYDNDLNKFADYLQDLYEGISLKKVESIHVRSYMVFLIESGLAKTTIARNISSIKSLYKFLLKESLVKSSPVNVIETPKLDRRLPSFLKEDEMSKLLNDVEFEDSFCGLRDKLILVIFYQTGMRLSEIIHLENGDVREAEIKVLGKRNKERIIPISSNLNVLIKKYLEKKAIKFPTVNWFFVTEKGNKMYEKFVYRKVNHYLSMVSSKQKKSPHILRHTFATHMLNNGADLNAIKELLGHENLSATQVYTHNTFQKLKSIHQQSHPRG